MNKNVSLKKNIILNSIKTVIGILVPLILSPYTFRVLNVENIGKINAARNHVNYFVALAGLGIQNYAIREGTKYYDDEKAFALFSSQIFSINIISTVISYILLIITIFLMPKLYNYKLLIYIESINILGSTIAVNWLYSLKEDFKYLTIRSIIMQLLVVALVFLFVKSENDYVIYSFIVCFCNFVINLIGFIHSRSVAKISIVLDKNILTHLKPIFTLFATSIAMLIYVNSDISMLTFMTDDYHLGLYSASVKIYTIIKNVIAAVFVVILPRLSFYVKNKHDAEYRNMLNKVLRILLLYVVPICIGLLSLSKEAVLFVGGDKYLEAETSLKILSIAIFFSIIATYFSNCILLPNNSEGIIFKSTVVSAIINILLNIVLIPKYKEIGASLTTLFSEMIVVFIEYKYSRYYYDFDKGDFLKILFASISIPLVCILLRSLYLQSYLYTILSIVISVILYFGFLYWLKNDYVKGIVKNLESILLKKIRRN